MLSFTILCFVLSNSCITRSHSSKGTHEKEDVDVNQDDDGEEQIGNYDNKEDCHDGVEDSLDH